MSYYNIFIISYVCYCIDSVLKRKHIHYYRPQRSWGKIIFSEACVKNSVHGEGGVIPACLAGGIPACLAGLGGVYPSMPCRFPGPHPEGSLRGLAWGGLQAHTQGEVEGSGLEGCLQAHTQGEVEGSGLGGLQAHTQRGLQAHRLGGL